MGTDTRKTTIILTLLLVMELVSTVVNAANPIVWSTCQDSYLQSVDAECGFVTVPLDYNRPWWTKIKIQLARKKHNASITPYQGVMLVTGGAGGLQDMEIAMIAPENVSAAYDWISFGSRGSQGNIPSINCLANHFRGPRPSPVPSTETLEKYWLNRSRTFAEACIRNASALLPYMRTIDIAKDIEQMRIALNVNKINYFGYSVGAYYGEVYATRYPDRMRRMLLDSSVDPRDVWFSVTQKFPSGYQRNIKFWFEWIAKYDDTYHLGSSACEVENKWNSLLKQLETSPIEGVIGPTDWFDIFNNAAKFQDMWPFYADLFSSWINDQDSTELMNHYEKNAGNNGIVYAANLATFCTDNDWPHDRTDFIIRNWRSYATYPMYTWSFANFYQPCQYWPSYGYTPIKINGSQVGPILLVSQRYDSVQPYEGNLEVRRRFPNAVLVSSVNGTSHSSVFYGNPCIDEKAADYLLTGTLPTRQSGNVADFECTNPTEPEPEEE